MIGTNKIITVTEKNMNGILRDDIKYNTILSEYYDNYYKQRLAINSMYLNNYDNKLNLIKTKINKKINGYKAQDEKKHIFNKISFIDFDNIVQKLVESKLKCFYCNCDIALIYSNNRQKNQWTLDRIDNDKGHNINNVLIACLKCNLARRDIDKDKFYFTKNLVIDKKI